MLHSIMKKMSDKLSYSPCRVCHFSTEKLFPSLWYFNGDSFFFIAIFRIKNATKFATKIYVAQQKL
jgi:hypothetical protein